MLRRQLGQKTRPTEPVSVDVMTGCYDAANKRDAHADGTHPSVHPPRWNGVALAYHGLKAQGWLRADAVSRRARRGMEACKQPKRMMLKASQPLAGG